MREHRPRELGGPTPDRAARRPDLDRLRRVAVHPASSRPNHEAADRAQPRDPRRRLPDAARVLGRGRSPTGRRPRRGNAHRQTLNRVGNSAPFFVFPLANPYLYSGNDVIDAHLLDWAANPANLRSIGLTIYGGPGNDLIIGSQTGDQLAGGSGDDTIMGQRGEDQIYGDSGFNVNLITRELAVAVVGTGPAGYSPAKFANKDLLAPGNDLLYGEGGRRRRRPTARNDDDIIFGDLGIVAGRLGARDVTKAVAEAAVSTTIFSDQLSKVNDRFGARRQRHAHSQQRPRRRLTHSRTPATTGSTATPTATS